MGICYSLKMRFCCAGSPWGTDVGPQSSRGSARVPPDWVRRGVARQIQVRPHLPPHEGHAAPARAHQGEHVRFDVGVVLSIYVHETGHVQALVGGMFVLLLLTWSAVPAIAR